MGKAAVMEAFEAINAAIAVLTAEAKGAGSQSSCELPSGDPLGGLADVCLGILAGAAGSEARFAALKAQAAAKYVESVQDVAPPDASPQAQEMAVTAELACVLTIGERAAGALLN